MRSDKSKPLCLALVPVPDQSNATNPDRRQCGYRAVDGTLCAKHTGRLSVVTVATAQVHGLRKLGDVYRSEASQCR